MLASLSSSIAASALAMALTKPSQPMKPRARIGLRLRDQMLGAAEADFQPHVVDAAEQSAQIGWRRFGKIERELRQQRVEQRGLPRLERMAFAPAEEGALRMRANLGSMSRLIPNDAESRPGTSLKTCMGRPPAFAVR